MKIKFLQAKSKITWVWILLGVGLATFFFIQTLTGRYDEVRKEAWEWLLPNILPSLTLVLSSEFLNRSNKSNQKVEKYLYIVSLILSSIYLLSIWMILFSYTSTRGNIIEYYKSYNIFLFSFHPLVTLSLGLFFLNKRD